MALKMPTIRLNNATRAMILKLTMWSFIILGVFKTFDLDALLSSVPGFDWFFATGFWSLFQEKAFYFLIGWFILSIFLFRGMPSLNKYIRLLKPGKR